MIPPAEPFFVVRMIHADMPTVWAAATEPKTLPRWMAASLGEFEVVRDDLVEGGAYEYRFGVADGPVRTWAGEYLEVWPPVRYLRTVASTGGEPWQYAFRLTPTENGTETAIIIHFADAPEPAVLDAMRRELEAGLERLAALAEAES